MTTPGVVPAGKPLDPASRSLASPDQKAVIDFHRNDDVDAIPESHHHTLGTQRVNASPGNHIHDGITSIAPLSAITFTGSRTSNAAAIINDICNALVLLGATNNTST
jgi:hypothetical protein